MPGEVEGTVYKAGNLNLSQISILKAITLLYETSKDKFYYQDECLRRHFQSDQTYSIFFPKQLSHFVLKTNVNVFSASLKIRKTVLMAYLIHHFCN